MCDPINLDVQPPFEAIDLLHHAMNDYRRDHGDWNKFEAADWLAKVFSAKWSAYSCAMRVNACMSDRGAENEEIVDLLG